MFGLSTVVIRWIGGILLALAIVFGIYYKGRLDERAVCNVYKAEIKAAADAQTADTIKKDAKSAKLIKETRDAYNTQLANLRAYYGLRLTEGGSPLPEIPGTSGGIDDYSPDNLPPTPVIAAQCAETTLKLVRLQDFNANASKTLE